MQNYLRKLISNGAKPVSQNSRSVNAVMPGEIRGLPEVASSPLHSWGHETSDAFMSDGTEVRSAVSEKEMGTQDPFGRSFSDQPGDKKNREAELVLRSSERKGSDPSVTLAGLHPSETLSTDSRLAGMEGKIPELAHQEIRHVGTVTNLSWERAGRSEPSPFPLQETGGGAKDTLSITDEGSSAGTSDGDNVTHADRDVDLSQPKSSGPIESAQYTVTEISSQTGSKKSSASEQTTAPFSEVTPQTTEPNRTVNAQPALNSRRRNDSTVRDPANKKNEWRSEPTDQSPEVSAVPVDTTVENKAKHHRFPGHIGRTPHDEATRGFGRHRQTESAPTLTIHRLDIQIIGQSPGASSQESRQRQMRSVSSTVSEIMDRHHLGRYSLSL